VIHLFTYLFSHFCLVRFAHYEITYSEGNVLL